MKFVIIFACLCGIALAGDKINFGNCQWLYGDATQIVTCPNGMVGVGACGNKGQTRCDGRAFGIKCCAIEGRSKVTTND